MTAFSYMCNIGPPVCRGVGCAGDVSSNPVELHEKLNGNMIHRLENIITLQMGIHRAFDSLMLWFKPVDVCVALLLYILINGHYRTLLIHTQSVLETVIDE